jgi:CO/xanthine dehydrogenase FAD-binding subunit
LKRFDYYDPQSIHECLELLGGNTRTIPLAGGTDLIPRMRNSASSATALVSLRRIEELNGISTNGVLAIGATTSLASLLRVAESHTIPAALCEASALVGSVQIRNAATLGGNICNAAPSADTAPALLALDGCAIVSDRKGERKVALAGFFKGPGITAVGQVDLLTRIEIPTARSGWGSCYLRHTPRSRMDLAVAGVAVAICVEGTSVVDARIALGAVAPIPMLAEEAAQRLIGKECDQQVVDAAVALAAAACAPIDDVRATAAYRRHLVSVLAKHAVLKAYARACASEKGAL